LQIQDRISYAVFRAADVKTGAGRNARKIRRAQQARLRREILDDFFPLPDVVSAGEDISARGEKILGDSRGDAEAGGRVFTIDDAEVYFALRENIREPVVNDFAAWRAYDVSNE
jgi:hypothetical protein